MQPLSAPTLENRVESLLASFEAAKKAAGLEGLELGMEWRHGDTGLAHRLSRLLAGRLYYCRDSEIWLVYDHRRRIWERRSEAPLLLGTYLEHVLTAEGAPAKILDRVETNAGLRAIFGLLKLISTIDTTETEFTKDAAARNLLAFNDGRVLELDSIISDPESAPVVRRAKPSDHITSTLPYSFDPEARCPRFEAASIENTNPELHAFLQRAAGYTLLPHNREQVAIWLFGEGQNGKSFFTERISRALGKLSCELSARIMFNSHNEKTEMTHRMSALADAQGSRMVLFKEIAAGSVLIEDLFKQIVSDDTFQARRLHRDWTSFPVTFTPWITSNPLPTIRDHGASIWDKIITIDFGSPIPMEKRNRKLGTEIDATELPGILNWMLEGLRDYLRGGLRVPESVKATRAKYRETQDHITAFIEECVDFVPTGRIARCDLHSAYDAWCRRNGATPYQSARFFRDFAQAAARAGHPIEETRMGKHDRRRGIVGVALDQLATDKLAAKWESN